MSSKDNKAVATDGVSTSTIASSSDSSELLYLLCLHIWANCWCKIAASDFLVYSKFFEHTINLFLQRLKVLKDLKMTPLKVLHLH